MTGSVAVDDDVLLCRVAAGDRDDALDELYRRYGPRVQEFGLRLLGNRGMAEELVQESFLRLWCTADRFDPSRGTVAEYLFTLARRLAVDLWRRPSSRSFVPTQTGRDTAVDSADAALTRLVIDDAMDALSPSHRAVLLLSYRGDLTQVEIAAVLGVPLGTVKTRTYHALRALRRALADRGVEG